MSNTVQQLMTREELLAELEKCKQEKAEYKRMYRATVTNLEYYMWSRDADNYSTPTPFLRCERCKLYHNPVLRHVELSQLREPRRRRLRRRLDQQIPPAGVPRI